MRRTAANNRNCRRFSRFFIPSSILSPSNHSKVCCVSSGSSSSNSVPAEGSVALRYFASLTSRGPSFPLQTDGDNPPVLAQGEYGSARRGFGRFFGDLFFFHQQCLGRAGKQKILIFRAAAENAPRRANLTRRHLPASGGSFWFHRRTQECAPPCRFQKTG